MGVENQVFRLLLMGILVLKLVNFVSSAWCTVAIKKYRYCNDTNKYGVEQAACCERVSYNHHNDYCDGLFKDYQDEGWRYYFNGTVVDTVGLGAQAYIVPIVIDRRNYINTCAREAGDKVFLAHPSDYGLIFHGKLSDYTNRLRFTDSVIAQEGLSFCIVGSHYRKSAFSLWDPLKPFLSLAEKRFDIGNHIDPEDSTKMNTFKRPKTADLRKWPTSNPEAECGMYCDAQRIPVHRFEDVWLGQIAVSNRWMKEYEVPLHRGFEKRPAHPEWQPDVNCKNPYRVTATLIESDGLTLHNYLHIKVYAEPVSQPPGQNCPTGKIKLLMLEVRDQDGYPVGQFTDDVACYQDEKSTSMQLSCPSGATCKSHQGTKLNIVPCMFSHSKSSVHPTIFMMAAAGSGGGSGSGVGSNPGGAGGPSSSTKDDFCRSNQQPKRQRNPPVVKYKKNPDQYVTEVHATWRYAQMDEAWVSELHFATLIVEDETPIQYYTSRLTHWAGALSTHWFVEQQYYDTSIGKCVGGTHCCWAFTQNSTSGDFKSGRFQLGLINSCVNETYNTNRPYGYSARYTMLRPTIHTRGGWDFFRKQYISPLDVNCHVDISYGPDFYYTRDVEGNPDKLGRLPLRKSLSEHLADKFTLNNPQKYKPPKTEFRYTDKKNPVREVFELPDWHSVGMTKTTDGNFRYHGYYGLLPEVAILKMFDSAYQDPVVLTTELDDEPFREYHGSRNMNPSSPIFNTHVNKLQTEIKDHDQEFTMDEMAKESKSRCPCPFVPTTPAAELATKSPLEIEGRRTHFVNMSIAWVILVPLAFFISRFFKETYSRVFFLQEFWWLAIHILSLITALLFSVGGIYALKAKRSGGEAYKVVWTDGTLMHIYFGYGVLGIFVVHLLVGSFRFSNTQLRMLQIGLHWLFGWLEYLFAAGSIMAAAAIPSGIMSCTTFGIYCGFIAFQVVFTLGMEYHMRRVDDILQLDPPRTYLPPPVMRIFHRDAPYAKFRVIMLVVFFLGCFSFYLALHISMAADGGENSCFQPTEESTSEEIG